MKTEASVPRRSSKRQVTAHHTDSCGDSEPPKRKIISPPVRCSRFFRRHDPLCENILNRGLEPQFFEETRTIFPYFRAVSVLQIPLDQCHFQQHLTNAFMQGFYPIKKRKNFEPSALQRRKKLKPPAQSRFAGPSGITEMSRRQPQTGDALLIIDLQNDFLPGGALPVPDGDKVIPKLNEWIDTFAGTNLPIFATRDWHPATHCSFKEQGGSWPPHCIVGSHGAEAPTGLHLPENAIIIRKPSAPERETYSGFEGTELASKLRESGVQRLFIGGLATDYCVLHTVLGALERGFHVVLLRDAIRPVNVRPEDGQNAEAEMIRKGAVPIDHEGGVHE